MAIGSKVAEERKKKGITQEALARDLGVSPPFISQIESGQKNPSYALLMKMATYFDLSVDDLFGTEAKGSREPSAKFIENVFNIIDKDKRSKLIDYIFLICGVKQFKNIPFLNRPSEYAEYIVRNYGDNTLPIDPAKILEQLGVRTTMSKEIMSDEVVLYKSNICPILVFDQERYDVQRVTFTLAMMLGHLVIPWHMRPLFSRPKDKTSLSEDDRLGIEAREFAGELLMPSHLLREDFKRLDVSLETLEKLAYDKYNVSLTAMGHKFIEMSSKNYAIITSSERAITRAYTFGLPHNLVGDIKPGSIVDTFYSNPPTEKEIRSGDADVRSWVIDPPKNLTIYEESLLDPKRGVAVTLLKFTLV
ncbi:MAG: XRE family transcriptional regulator [Syntrophobacteraceae bacterium]|jgi:transcriptional regulator with XRE-family HTH domain